MLLDVFAIYLILFIVLNHAHFTHCNLSTQYLHMSDQYLNAVPLLHALKLLLSLFHLVLQMCQSLQQLLLCVGQRPVAPNDGLNRSIRAIIKVCCNNLV